MKHQAQYTHAASDHNTKRLTPMDFSRIADEVRQGGISAVPAFLATRWGLSVGDARSLISKYQSH